MGLKTGQNWVVDLSRSSARGDSRLFEWASIRWMRKIPHRTGGPGIGVAHQAVNLSKGNQNVGRVYHIQNANAYDSQLKGWMRRFHGVAPKTLGTLWAGGALSRHLESIGAPLSG